MKAGVEIEAGICGFRTTVEALSEDDQHVRLKISSDCEKITALAANIDSHGELDAYQEINPAGRSLVLESARACLSGCCAGCIVPAGVFKGMQVACGLALPQEARVRIFKF
jgi:hypothetical protein